MNILNENNQILDNNNVRFITPEAIVPVADTQLANINSNPDITGTIGLLKEWAELSDKITNFLNHDTVYSENKLRNPSENNDSQHKTIRENDKNKNEILSSVIETKQINTMNISNNNKSELGFDINEFLKFNRSVQNADVNMKSTWWSSRFGISCGVCKLNYFSKTVFDKHYKDLHSTSTIVYICSLCHQQTEYYNKFRNHCYKHFAKGRFTCIHCPSLKFTQEEHLSKHLTLFHSDATGKDKINSNNVSEITVNNAAAPTIVSKSSSSSVDSGAPSLVDAGKLAETISILCVKCKQKYIGKTFYDMHYKKKHSKSDIIYTCSRCNKNFQSYDEFTNHCNIHEDLVKYSCSECPSTYAKKIHLWKHMKASHPTGKQQSQASTQPPQKTIEVLPTVTANNNNILENNFGSSGSNQNGNNINEKLNTKINSIIYQDFCINISNLFESDDKHNSIAQTDNIPTVESKDSKEILSGDDLQDNSDGVSTSGDNLSDLVSNIDLNELNSEMYNWKTIVGILCGACSQKFTLKSAFDEHYHETHSDIVMYTCPLCKFRDENYDRFRDHCYRHYIKGRFKCCYCSNRFPKLNRLMYHIKAVHPDSYQTEGKLLQQIFKGSHFQTAGVNRQTISTAETAAPNNNNTFEETHSEKNNRTWLSSYGIFCCKCKTKFNDKLSYHFHYAEKHPDVGIIYTCSVCSQEYDNYKCFTNHCLRHFYKGSYKCSECTSTFSKFRTLLGHTKAMHSGNSRAITFPCGVCKRTYLTQDRYNYHLQYKCLSSHRGAYPSPSKSQISSDSSAGSSLDKYNNSGSKLNGEVKSVSLSNDIYNGNIEKVSRNSNIYDDDSGKQSIWLLQYGIRCFKCKKQFPKKRLFIDHYQLEHPKDDLIYSCSICDKQSYVYKHFLNHSYKHFRGKKFKCKFCSLSISQKSCLMTHMSKCTQSNKNIEKEDSITDNTKCWQLSNMPSDANLLQYTENMMTENPVINDVTIRNKTLTEHNINNLMTDKCIVSPETTNILKDKYLFINNSSSSVESDTAACDIVPWCFNDTKMLSQESSLNDSFKMESYENCDPIWESSIPIDCSQVSSNNSLAYFPLFDNSSVAKSERSVADSGLGDDEPFPSYLTDNYILNGNTSPSTVVTSVSSEDLSWANDKCLNEHSAGNNSALEDNLQLTCCVCCDNFKSKSEYDGHFVVQHPDWHTVYSCSICKRDFLDFNIYMKHNCILKTKNFKKSWLSNGILCGKCDLKFPKRCLFHLHFAEKHMTDVVYTCSWCKKDFDNYEYFRGHCYRHFVQGRFSCRYCSRRFIKLSKLSAHIKVMHPECARSENNKENVIHDVKETTNSNQYNSVSENSNKTFHSNISYLEEQMYYNIDTDYVTDKIDIPTNNTSNNLTNMFELNSNNTNDIILFQVESDNLNDENLNVDNCNICRNNTNDCSHIDIDFHTVNNFDKTENILNLNEASSKLISNNPSQSQVEEVILYSSDNSDKVNNEPGDSHETHLSGTDEIEISDQQYNMKDVLNILCKRCDKKFAKRLLFESHCQLEHVGHDIIYTCALCSRECNTYRSFRNHRYRHMGRFKCNYCPKRFVLQSSFLKHLKAIHRSAAMFPCHMCDKIYQTEMGLKFHIRSRHTDDNRNHPCHHCGIILKSRNGLLMHMATHKEQSKCLCHICGQLFSQKINMIEHIKYSHRQLQYQCNICSKNFHRKSLLSRHISLHHSDQRRQCKVCQRWYKNEYCLGKHSLIHSERNYTCRMCDKKFLTSAKLKEHIDTHTKKKPHQCQFCRITFTHVSNLLNHIRKQHKMASDESPQTNSIPVIEDSLQSVIITSEKSKHSVIYKNCNEIKSSYKDIVSCNDKLSSNSFLQSSINDDLSDCESIVSMASSEDSIRLYSEQLDKDNNTPSSNYSRDSLSADKQFIQNHNKILTGNATRQKYFLLGVGDCLNQVQHKRRNVTDLQRSEHYDVLGENIQQNFSKLEEVNLNMANHTEESNSDIFRSLAEEMGLFIEGDIPNNVDVNENVETEEIISRNLREQLSHSYINQADKYNTIHPSDRNKDLQVAFPEDSSVINNGAVNRCNVQEDSLAPFNWLNFLNSHGGGRDISLSSTLINNSSLLHSTEDISSNMAKQQCVTNINSQQTEVDQSNMDQQDPWFNNISNRVFTINANLSTSPIIYNANDLKYSVQLNNDSDNMLVEYNDNYPLPDDSQSLHSDKQIHHNSDILDAFDISIDDIITNVNHFMPNFNDQRIVNCSPFLMSNNSLIDENFNSFMDNLDAGYHIE